MNLHDLIELLEVAGASRDDAFTMAFYHFYNRRTAASDRRQDRGRLRPRQDQRRTQVVLPLHTQKES